MIPTRIPIKIPIVKIELVVFLSFSFSEKKITKGLPISETTKAIII